MNTAASAASANTAKSVLSDKVSREKRIADGEIALAPYSPNDAAALPWYQDPALCRQADNRDGGYDLELLKRMYSYLNRRGDLYYIKYRNRLCGDVCLHPDGEINIVVAAPFQNRHIGRRVIGELVRMAKEKGIPRLHAEIYSFNAQSQRMFERAEEERYELEP